LFDVRSITVAVAFNGGMRFFDAQEAQRESQVRLTSAGGATPAAPSVAPEELLGWLGAFGLDTGPAGPVRLIETGASWVYLLPRYVLKQKKPIAGRVLDLTTLAARERNARRELAINRAFSADVYLGLRVVCWGHGGRLRLVEPAELGDGDQPMDWLVLMRRLPQSRMLDHLIRQGRLSPVQVDVLADRLLLVHSAARPTRFGPMAWLERFEHEHQRCHTLFSAHGKTIALQALALTQQAGERLRLKLKVRFGRGSVIQAHGDLRPAHVCLQSQPQFIDALDAKDLLRQLDPWEDLALLSLECGMSGAGWLGERLRRRYADSAPKRLAYPGCAISAYYRAHHAMVRARLALAHLDAPRVHRRRDWSALCGRYAAEAWAAADRALALT
jgi:aminoglycoside phosphotransferase family enzyme